MNDHLRGTPWLSIHPSYGTARRPTPVEFHHGDFVDAAADAWSVTSNSPHSRSIDHHGIMTRSQSADSWSLLSHPTPSPRSHMSPDRDYVNAGLPLTSPDDGRDSYLGSPTAAFDQDSFMTFQAAQSASPDPRQVWSDSFIHHSRASPMLEESMDDNAPFDFHHEPSISSFNSTTAGEISHNYDEQPWSTGQVQQHMQFAPYELMHNLAVSIPMSIPQYAATATYTSQLPLPTSSLDYEFMNSIQFADHVSQRHSSSSSTPSHPTRLTPEYDPVETPGNLPQHTSRLSIQHDVRLGMAGSMIAQSGSTSTSEVAPSPPQIRLESFVKTGTPAVVAQKRTRTVKVETPPWQISNQEPSFSASSATPVAAQRPSQQRQTSIGKKMTSKRKGGREANVYKLPPKKAQEVRERREQGACWTCALQRDVCSGGVICNRCQKRIERGLMEATDNLCCVREKLYDFMHYFVPQHLVRTYDDKKMVSLAEENINKFSSIPIRLHIQPIRGIAMTFEADFYEFEPKSKELIIQRIHRNNPVTGQSEMHTTSSPPISLRRVGNGPEDKTEYDDFLMKLTEECMGKFSSLCYSSQKNDFLAQLLQLMVQYNPQNTQESEFITSVNKMLVVCYVLGRTCEVPEQEQHKLHNIHWFKRFADLAGNCNFKNVPRMANRQIKYVFLRILQCTMDNVLRRLDRVYRSSKGCREWLMAFYGVLGLAMAFEDLQNTVHGFLKADVNFQKFGEAEAERRLRDATREIDKRFNYMAKLFRTKYHRQFNPLKNHDDPQLRQNLGDEVMDFVARVADLVDEKYDDFLCDHQHCAVNYESDMNLYYGRLVSQFLCSFFGPSA